MKDYTPDKIRNVALAGHGGTGKTSLAEAMLFASGATTRLGKIEDGSTASDWDPDEQKRQFSLNVSTIPLEWKDHKVNVVDTPGYMDFMGEVKCGLRAVETALITIDAVGGVQVGTEFAWRFADELELPRAIFINRMDRENADFEQAVQQIQAAFGAKCIPAQLPIGSQASFKGVVDVLAQKAYVGDKGEEAAIPDDMQAAADQAREKLIEAAAETDDALITKYLEGGDLTPEELSTGVKAGIANGSIVPIFTGAATKLIGIHSLLNAIVSMFPAPIDRATNVDGKELKADPAGPLVALVFKTAADPYVGRLTYFKVLSGTLKGDSHTWNTSRNVDERIGAVYRITGKTQEQVPHVVAGDIGAVAKLADTHTGETLATKGGAKLDTISFPSPSFSAAVSPKTKADLDKMGSALQRIVEEDPSLHLERNPATGEMILSGLGDSHVEVNLERIKRKFGVDLEMHTPRIPYRETVRGTAAGRVHAQEADRRPRPVRTRSPGSVATRPRRRRQVRGQDRRRRRAEAVRRLRREGRQRRQRRRHPRPLPDGRHESEACRRQGTPRRLVRHRLQDRGIDGPQAGNGGRAPDHPRADHEHEDHGAGLQHRRRHQRPQRQARPRLGHDADGFDDDDRCAGAALRSPALLRRHALSNAGPRLLLAGVLALRGGARTPVSEDHRPGAQGPRGRESLGLQTAQDPIVVGSVYLSRTRQDRRPRVVRARGSLGQCELNRPAQHGEFA